MVVIMEKWLLKMLCPLSNVAAPFNMTVTAIATTVIAPVGEFI